ncbi:MAG: hypothetical protein N4A50_11980 [Vallitalea sp.]|jgi:hypothetical protein|nr:hypothetical protein [Vallitalea sp.]
MKKILSMMCLVCLLAVQTINVDASGVIQTQCKILVNGVDVKVTDTTATKKDQIGAKVVFYNKQGEVVGTKKVMSRMKNTQTFEKVFTNNKAKYGQVEVTIYKNDKVIGQTCHFDIKDFYEEPEKPIIIPIK